MNPEDEQGALSPSQQGHETYRDKKKKSQKSDLDSLRRNLFQGDADRMEHIMREYRLIQKEKKADSAVFATQASHPLNEHKNRYPDVLPFESTLVKLEPIEGVAGSEYINANFVTDLGAPPERPSQKYICCQAPLVHTFNDFWRMVWEQHAPLIVMITNLVEGNKIKADTYWPTRVDQTLRFGLISVKLTREYHRGHSVMIRTFHVWKNLPPVPAPSSSPSPTPTSPNFNFNFGFTANSGSDADESPRPISGSSADEAAPSSSVLSSTPVTRRWDTGSGYNSEDDRFSFSSSSSESDLEPIDGQEVRKVTQLHCTKWPDFGVPESAQVMKDLIYELELRKRRLEDPVVVHCSAGIGRTGTFVAIHQALQKDLHGELISIRDISKEQYVFLYGVVSEMLRDRDSLLSLRSKKYKRLSYIPTSSGTPANDSISAKSLHADKTHLVATSPRLRESVNQHLILTQSSPFAPVDLGRKGQYFHEKIIEHSLTSSSASLTSSSLKSQPQSQSQSHSQPLPISAAHFQDKQHSLMKQSRGSSPQLAVPPTPPNSLAKSSELVAVKKANNHSGNTHHGGNGSGGGGGGLRAGGSGVDSAANKGTRPRGRSMPYLMRRSVSEDPSTSTSTSPATSTLSAAPGHPTPTINPTPPPPHVHSNGHLNLSRTTDGLLAPPSLMDHSARADALRFPGQSALAEDLEALQRTQSRAKLRMASDAITITSSGNSTPDLLLKKDAH